MGFSYLFFLVFVVFSFSPEFSSKISPEPFKIEALNFIYRFTTSCIVELKMSLLLLVLSYISSFFFLSIVLSKISPQPFKFKIETSNLVYRSTMT